MINFNRFDNIYCTNSGANPCYYGIKFDNGSGTGNIYAENDFICNIAGIQIGTGASGYNVGDITISSSNFGGVGSAGVIVNGNTNAYTSNLSIMGCQFDAGISYAYQLVNMNQFTIKGCLGIRETHLDQLLELFRV